MLSEPVFQMKASFHLRRERSVYLGYFAPIPVNEHVHMFYLYLALSMADAWRKELEKTMRQIGEELDQAQKLDYSVLIHSIASAGLGARRRVFRIFSCETSASNEHWATVTGLDVVCPLLLHTSYPGEYHPTYITAARLCCFVVALNSKL